MRRLLHLLVFPLLLLSAMRTQAQVLEEVSFGPGTNTHLTHINNRGFVTGWYDSAGYTKGFLINPDGVILRSLPTATTTAVKFMGINDHNVVLVSSNVSGAFTPYKSYYDSDAVTLSAYVGVNGNQQPTLAQPYSISNNNDISGWYQGAAYRFLWVLHDSLPTTPQWVFDKYLTYNTEGTGVNDAGTATGFAINGSNYYPYVYNTSTNTFTILNTAFHMKPWGINNNNVIVGEYQQTAGYNTAFWGQVNMVTGIVTTHAMNSLWVNPNTQSVANGVNDKTEIVGEYVHPTTGNYVGFIYRPNTSEYRLPGYSWNRHTYNTVNATVTIGGHPPVWSTNYYGAFNYYTTDPYANNGAPLINAVVINASPGANNPAYFPASRSPDWKSIATELDSFHIGTDPTKLAQYQGFWKPWAFKKWRSYTKQIVFPGICYGFAFTSLIRYADSNLYQSWYGVPATTNLYSIVNNNSAAVSAVARTFFKQNDKTAMLPYGISHQNEVLPWSGLFRLKNTWQDPVANRRNPRAIYIHEQYVNATTGAITYGYHSILPYKIHTPQQFPFVQGTLINYDTVYVYDSNFPNDSAFNDRFVVNSDKLYSPTDSAKGYGHTVVQIAFNEAGIKDIAKIEHGKYKGASASSELPFATVAIGSQPYYSVTGAGGTHATLNATGYANNISYFTSDVQKDTGFHSPDSYSLDTLQQVAFSSTHYADSIMAWDLTNNHRTMSLGRTGALLTETDNSTLGNHIMTYGTHDAAVKTLTANFIEMNDHITQGVNVMATNITMKNGDSLVTTNPSQYVYQIKRISTTADTYDLWIFVAGADDSVRQYKVTGIPIGPNSTHTIDPYAGGPNGTEVDIKVDAGNNGTIDSTIILHVSLGIDAQKLPQGYVKLYPNPADAALNVAFSGDLPKGAGIMIVDAMGRTVVANVAVPQGSRSITIPLNELAPGTYFLRILNDGGGVIYSDKFVRR